MYYFEKLNQTSFGIVQMTDSYHIQKYTFIIIKLIFITKIQINLS